MNPNLCKNFMLAAFQIFAILPVVEKIDWLFYTSAALLIALWITAFVLLVIAAVKQRKVSILLLLGDCNRVNDLIVSLSGLAISYVLEPKMIWVWVVFLVFAVLGELEILIKMKKKA